MRRIWMLAAFLLVACGIVVAAPMVGSKLTPLSAILHPDMNNIDSQVFWMIRLPRVLAAFLAGMGLAVSGMTFQAMFRNPLATESTLGVASGASVGAAVYVRLGLSFLVLGVSGLSVFAFAGALLAILLVWGLTRIRRGFSTTEMLLAGVAIGFFFSSLILLVQSTVDFQNSYRLLSWLMGGLGTVGYDSCKSMLPFVAIGTLIVLYLSNELNLITIGDDVAITRGVNVNRVKMALFFAVSLMVGGIAAVCGPIGFVGMIVPHICRLIIGPDHRYLIPATLLMGGAFLTGCDTLARMVVVPAELPVGTVTAFIGGPFFVWLLVSGKAKRAG